MRERQSTYVDEWGNTQPRATVTVFEEAREGTITYRNDEGGKFRVRIIQRANPIGFRAALPSPRAPSQSLKA